MCCTHTNLGCKRKKYPVYLFIGAKFQRIKYVLYGNRASRSLNPEDEISAIVGTIFKHFL